MSPPWTKVGSIYTVPWTLRGHGSWSSAIIHHPPHPPPPPTLSTTFSASIYLPSSANSHFCKFSFYSAIPVWPPSSTIHCLCSFPSSPHPTPADLFLVLNPPASLPCPSRCIGGRQKGRTELWSLRFYEFLLATR